VNGGIEEGVFEFSSGVVDVEMSTNGGRSTNFGNDPSIRRRLRPKGLVTKLVKLFHGHDVEQASRHLEKQLGLFPDVNLQR